MEWAQSHIHTRLTSILCNYFGWEHDFHRRTFGNHWSIGLMADILSVAHPTGQSMEENRNQVKLMSSPNLGLKDDD